MSAVKRLLAMLMLAAAGMAQAAQAPTGAEASYDRLRTLDRETFGLEERLRVQKISARYESDFRPRFVQSELTAATNADLGFIYQAAYLAAFYSRNPTYLQDMQGVLDELERRGAADDGQRALLYRTLIAMRRFDRSGAYLSEHPGLDVEPTPRIGDVEGTARQGPIVYAVDDDGATLRPRHVDIASGTHLVVIAHPLCGFSRRAMEALAADAELAPFIERHAVWVAPVDQRLSLDVLSAWNREHPATPVVIARHTTDWPMFDAWATPQFYLLRDGELLGRISGWPNEGQGHRKQLVELLAELQPADQPLLPGR